MLHPFEKRRRKLVMSAHVKLKRNEISIKESGAEADKSGQIVIKSCGIRFWWSYDEGKKEEIPSGTLAIN